MTRPPVADAVAAIRARAARAPDVALVLGSGLGGFADELEDAVAVPFADIPGFPAAGVLGHAGRMVLGQMEGLSCVVLQGRLHLYEGHDSYTVSLPTRAMLALGARTLIVTNAAGGIHPGLQAGDLMLIDDHLNLMGANPLLGPVLAGETRFPDMTRAYDPGLQQIAARVAEEQGMPLARGVYAALLGPTYETPAEVRMLARLGADVVGMSTVPEVIVARALGTPVLGISLVTNAAAGISPTPLSHEEVMAAGTAARDRFARLLRGVLRELAQRGA